MKVLLTGATGQASPDRINEDLELISTSRKELDLTDKRACQCGD